MTREVIKDQENILLIAKRSVSPSCTVYLVTINALLQLKASDKPTSLSFIFVTVVFQFYYLRDRKRENTSLEMHFRSCSHGCN